MKFNPFYQFFVALPLLSLSHINIHIITFTIIFTAGEALTTNRNLKIVKNENILLSLSSNLPASGDRRMSSGGDLILLGMVDLIRSGIQKRRVLRILKNVKSEISEILKMNIQYQFIPIDIQSKKSILTKNGSNVENVTSDVSWKEKEKLKSEFLYSEKVDFSVFLPDCLVQICATPRYGFEVKSVITNTESTFASTSSTSSPSVKECSSRNHRCESPPLSSSSSSSLVQCNSRSSSSSSSSKHHGSSLSGFTKCDSLFHPMNARFDNPHHLSQFLFSVALGAYLR